MNPLLGSFVSIPWQPCLGNASMESEENLLRLFYLLCCLAVIVGRVLRSRHVQVQQEAGCPRPTVTVTPAEVGALVGQLAQEILGIGPEQLNESMEDLRIPRGDYLGFLDELEEEHGLPVPAPARAMSMSISGVVAAICAET